MTQHSHRVAVTEHYSVDEAAIRAAFLSGERPGAIANRYGEAGYGVVAHLIYANKQRWLSEEPFSRELSDHRRLVLHRHVESRNGSHVIRVSVPRVSSHVALLLEGQP